MSKKKQTNDEIIEKLITLKIFSDHGDGWLSITDEYESLIIQHIIKERRKDLTPEVLLKRAIITALIDAVGGRLKGKEIIAMSQLIIGLQLHDDDGMSTAIKDKLMGLICQQLKTKEANA